jgi:hypothetical protein
VTNTHTGMIGSALSVGSGGDTIVTNAGGIDGPVTFAGSGSTSSLTNSGKVTGLVSFSGGYNTIDNSGTIDGSVTFGAGDTLTDTGTIRGTVTLGASDTFDVSPGIVSGAINASTTDLFEFSGNFGNVTIDDFGAGGGVLSDTIQFAADDFGTFSQVQQASSQVGSDVVIRLDATDAITLNNVTLSSLVSADFKFV